MRSRRPLVALALAAWLVGATLAGQAAARSIVPRTERAGLGVRVLSARTFLGPGGHLFTTAAVRIDGRPRVVTAPGGRLGPRWESVEAVPAAGSPAARTAPMLRDGLGLSRAAASAATGIPPLLGYGFCGRQMPVPYRINRAGFSSAAVPAIQRAFTTWGLPADSFVAFRNVGTSARTGPKADGVNVVWFAFRSEGFLGYTWVYGNGSRMTGFDMVLNRRYPLITRGSAGFDLQSLVTHEAGHAAGLGHSHNADDVMYPSLTYGAQKRALNQGDLDALRGLYPTDDFRAQIVAVTPPPDSMKVGEAANVAVTFRNVGRTPWGGTAVPAQVHTDAPEDRKSLFDDGSWPAKNHPADARGALCPGETATARWTMTAPVLPLSFDESFALVGPTPGGLVRASDTVTFHIQVRVI